MLLLSLLLLAVPLAAAKTEEPTHFGFRVEGTVMSGITAWEVFLESLEVFNAGTAFTLDLDNPANMIYGLGLGDQPVYEIRIVTNGVEEGELVCELLSKQRDGYEDDEEQHMVAKNDGKFYKWSDESQYPVKSIVCKRADSRSSTISSWRSWLQWFGFIV